MIKVQRLTVDSDKPYENVSIPEHGESFGYPNFFEDSNFSFRDKMGTFSVPYYAVTLIQLNNTQMKDGILVKRLTVSGDMSFENVKVLRPESYSKNGIPIIFPLSDQFVFSDKSGTYITSDYQISLVRFE